MKKALSTRERSSDFQGRPAPCPLTTPRVMETVRKDGGKGAFLAFAVLHIFHTLIPFNPHNNLVFEDYQVQSAAHGVASNTEMDCLTVLECKREVWAGPCSL